MLSLWNRFFEYAAILSKNWGPKILVENCRFTKITDNWNLGKFEPNCGVPYFFSIFVISVCDFEWTFSNFVDKLANFLSMNSWRTASSTLEPRVKKWRNARYSKIYNIFLDKSFSTWHIFFLVLTNKKGDARVN